MANTVVHPTHLASTPAVCAPVGAQVSQDAGSTRANSAVCLVALKTPPCSEQTPCDSWVAPFTVLTLGELASLGEQAGSNSDTVASDPRRLWSSVPFKRKRAALWGQKLYFSHDVVCSEESAGLCS